MGIFKSLSKVGKKVLKAETGFAVGFAKGIADLPREAAELGRTIGGEAGKKVGKAIRPVVQSVLSDKQSADLNKSASSFKQSLEQGTQQTNFTKPQNTAEKIGFGAEKVAEYFVPSTLAAKGTKAMFGAERVAQAGKGITQAVKGSSLGATVVKDLVQSAPIILTRAGLEGAGAAAVTALQTGDLKKADKAAAGAALFSGGLQVLNKAVTPVARLLAEKTSGRVIDSLIKPKKNDLLFGKDPSKAITEEGIVATSRGDLLNKVKAKSDEVYKTLQTQVDEVGKGIAGDFSGILDDIDGAMKDAAKIGDQTTVNQLKSIRTSITDKLDIDEAGNIISTGKRDLKNLSLSDALDLKRQIGKAATWTDNKTFDKLANQARVSMYGKINDTMDELVPLTKNGKNFKALNSKLANLITAEKSIENSIVNATRANILGLTGTAGAGVGVLQSQARGEDALTTVIRSAAYAALGKVLGSTVAKTSTAKGLQKFDKALEAGLEFAAKNSLPLFGAIQQALRQSGLPELTNEEAIQLQQNTGVNLSTPVQFGDDQPTGNEGVSVAEKVKAQATAKGIDPQRLQAAYDALQQNNGNVPEEELKKILFGN